MIPVEQLRTYHRELALHCLGQGEAQTVADVHDSMIAAAESLRHPRACAEISVAGVAGILRELANRGLVQRGPMKWNSRNGRDEVTWWPTELANMPAEVPAAPGTIVPTSQTGSADPFSHMSREQLAAVLLMGDELGELVADFVRRVDEIKARAMAVLTGRATYP
ncbi:MAG: hypothetical protein LBL59_08850 [Xanthomonadaceae bacterium]|jgi:hypothetical protein|nr:hypothetical protein [Xanthomonadaceae bacterium]